MARHRISSLDGRGIPDFDELIHKKIHRILRSCLTALYFDPTTLIEIAVGTIVLKCIAYKHYYNTNEVLLFCDVNAAVMV